MKFTVLTLFPEIFDLYLSQTIIQRAVDMGIVDYEIINIREFSGNKHGQVDDTPFGGGQTVVTPQTQIDLRQSGGSLQSVRSSANLNSVVRALNALGATPMDLMSILQSMQSAGCLRAKLEII